LRENGKFPISTRKGLDERGLREVIATVSQSFTTPSLKREESYFLRSATPQIMGRRKRKAL